MKKLAYILLLVFSLCGCARKPEVAPPAGPPSFGTLEHGQIIYVAVPKDVPAFDDIGMNTQGRVIDNQRFPGTGARTASLMKDAFTPYASRVIVGTNYETPEQALASAKAHNARYVFVSDFDILMRRRYSSLESRHYKFTLAVKFFDALREGEPYSTNVNVYSDTMPAYRTEKEIDTLTGPIADLAKFVFEGKRPKITP